MAREVMFSDGSVAYFYDGGGSTHDGGLAIQRLRLIAAQMALSTYIRSGGKWQTTANGAHKAIVNVIQPITGIKYARSMKGKEAALRDCQALLKAMGESVVVLDT